jgi:hypothetical protein
MGGIITCPSNQVKATLTYIDRSITDLVSFANYVSYHYHYILCITEGSDFFSGGNYYRVTLWIQPRYSFDPATIGMAMISGTV